MAKLEHLKVQTEWKLEDEDLRQVHVATGTCLSAKKAKHLVLLASASTAGGGALGQGGGLPLTSGFSLLAGDAPLVRVQESEGCRFPLLLRLLGSAPDSGPSLSTGLLTTTVDHPSTQEVSHQKSSTRAQAHASRHLNGAPAGVNK